ncbi:MAG TPA: putative sugar O-methyltransferase [Solirubrobacteraceae bacterium]|jgi:SAM-dependent methyltransferase
MRGAARLRRFVSRPEPPGPPAELVTITAEDREYLTKLYQDTVPLPTAAQELVPDHRELVELRAAYESLDLPVVVRSRWHEGAVGSFLDLRWFRGETLFVWHYREIPRISQLKYYVFARYVLDRDHLGLLDRLEEDGMFGCWTFSYPGWREVSRDLLQSVNEISFLDRTLQVSQRSDLSVLDIGAGYGRLAHRMATALPGLANYCCTDVIPEATFLSRWYLAYRGCSPPARVVRLDRIESELEPGSFDLAVNMHSFSECPMAAIQWWVDLVARLEVPYLLIVPNEPQELLSTEPDGSRRDFSPILTTAGYALEHREPVIGDPAAQELIPLRDHFHLFKRR